MGQRQNTLHWRADSFEPIYSRNGNDLKQKHCETDHRRNDHRNAEFGLRLERITNHLGHVLSINIGLSLSDINQDTMPKDTTSIAIG